MKNVTWARASMVVALTVTSLYAVFMLGLAATSPDFGLRCLLTDQVPEAGGLRIRDVTHAVVAAGCARPGVGDVVVQIGNQPVRTFADFAAVVARLRGVELPAGGQLDAGSDISELIGQIPWLVAVEGKRYVRVEFQPADGAERQVTYLQLHSLPLTEVLLSLVWFLCFLPIYVVAAVAVWYRPFDQSARLFFSTCALSLLAFMGGFHWWIIASRLWLMVPFVVGASLLPVTLLHFFNVYPNATPAVRRLPRHWVTVIYSVPVCAIVGFVGLLGYIEWLQTGQTDVATAARVAVLLQALRDAIYGYVVFAAGCFVLTLAAVAYNSAVTRRRAEKAQMKWILAAAATAAVLVGYVLYLAFLSGPEGKVRFAFGWETRLCMFFACLSFLLAYGVGIVRFKLLLMDQLVSKGMVYSLASAAITVGFATAIAAVTVLAGLRTPVLTTQQSVFLVLVLTLVVGSMLWLRDQLQQAVDRRFYREKYQLDRALEEINRAVEQFADRRVLADRMIASCRDVLRVKQAAIYSFNGETGEFELLSRLGEAWPQRLRLEAGVLQSLRTEKTLHRGLPGLRGSSPVQRALRQLDAHLLYALEIRGELVGLVALSAKGSGTPFTAEDLTFLNALGQVTGVAIQSQELRRNFARLNEELQRKAAQIEEQRRRIAMMQNVQGDLSAPDEPPQARTTPKPEKDFRRGLIRGNSPAIRRVLETARKVAASDASVLLLGESGTGKEMLAQVIHENSPRRDGPFVAVHCAALSPGLLESELFGHVKGAFTGAHRDRIGRFEAANGGTLFLDEIGDISLETQVKLLRVLQTRSFEPVGSTRTIHVDVRLITATHQDLPRLIREGKFREDLYYRLNVITLLLPPLRERKEDIVELAYHFLEQATRRLGKKVTRIEDAALDALHRYDWPGNIRELENAIERAVVLADGDTVRLKDLPTEVTVGADVVRTRRSTVVRPGLTTTVAPSVARAVGPTGSGWQTDSERALLLEALQRCGGNKAQAARLLGMPRSTYYSKLKKYGLVEP